jgi:hypothetical protein
MSEAIEGIKQIPETDIARIARSVFGSSASVDSIEEIRPSSGGGVPRITGCNWNLSYIVDLSGHETKYVFRFNRQRYGRDDKAIVQET